MKTKLCSLLSIFCICIVQPIVFAQDAAQKIPETLEGYWQGAFIKNNSFQKFDIQFYKEKEKLNSLQVIKEWHPQFGEFVVPVTVDSLQQIRLNTGYGKATLQLDSKSLELNGIVDGSVPAIYVHLKKIPNPPPSNYTVEQVTVKSDTISLFGHLHQPKTTSKTAIILVGGRSCYAGSTKYDLYAKLLRAYGISVLVYNKRGTGKSSGDCSKATISDLAADVVACKNYLEAHPNNYEHIGVLGSSAGGWVMAKAEESTDFDFMISIVGPSTSVKEQQLQSMNYGFDFYKLSQAAKDALVEYTEMMFTAKPTQASFKRFEELLASSKQNGWDELLDDTDIPKSATEISNLWVRRHAYDPKQVLSSFNKPFLAIYGEIDWIVPYKENVARLKEVFSDTRTDLLNITIAYDAEHGTETKEKYRTLTNDKSYWRFFRIAPSVQISIIDFLMKYDFIDKK
jgi:pimeloyl-ACP methyl ester carboxylesterase